MVQVRSAQEIMDTLTPDGTLDGLPFMAEMLRYCGQNLRVYRRAEKTCVEGFGIRRIKNTVLLEGVRCDGRFHDGCQRRCLFFWKEEWLKPAQPPAPLHGQADALDSVDQRTFPTQRDGKFWCQSTQLHHATSPLPWWDVRQYPRDWLVGELTLGQLVEQFWLLASNRLRRMLGKLGIKGAIAKRSDRADASLRLQLGEIVEIKSPAEIEATLDPEGKNLGLEFTPDMVPYCHGRYRVAGRVDKIILECTAKMRHISDTVILENLVCNGCHARNCPRANYYYWREAWLRRVCDHEGLSPLDAPVQNEALAAQVGAVPDRS